jgi:DNA-binding transcriptional MerR regulator
VTATEPAVVERLYTSPEVLAVTGTTYRQLDYWCRAGYLDNDTASGPGTRRLFTSDEVDTVHAVRGLLAAGFDVSAAFAIARTLVADGRWALRVADIYEISITVRDTSDPVTKPEAATTERTSA